MDGGEPRRSGSVELIVTITDVNDNSPTFASATSEARVREDSAVGTVIYRASAADADVGLNAALHYQFTAETQRQHGATFDINGDSGAVLVAGVLDYETTREYSLYVTATDRSGAHDDDGSTLTGMMSIVVRVEDVNDHAPEIAFSFRRPSPDNHHDHQSDFQHGAAAGNQPFPVATVGRAADVGSFVAHVSVHDADDGENGRFRCVLLSSSAKRPEVTDSGSRFALRQFYDTEYTIVTTGRLDDLAATRDTVTLAVYCADGGRPALTSEANVIVSLSNHVDDINDGVIAKKVVTVAVAEDVPIGTRIYCPRSLDTDENSVVKSLYRISGSSALQFFDVDATSGLLSTKLALNRQIRCRFGIDLRKNVDATSTGQHAIRLSVVVVDVNRRRFSHDYDDSDSLRNVDVDYEFSVAENSRRGTYVGSISAEDMCLPTSDKDDQIIYKLVGKDASSLSRLFHVGAGDGRLTTLAPLDRELRRHYTLFILTRLSTAVVYVDASGCRQSTARPRAVMEALARLYVSVTDVNDNPPVFEFPRTENDVITVSRSASAGDVVSRVVARDKDAGDNASLLYRIESDTVWSRMFNIDQKTGVECCLSRAVVVIIYRHVQRNKF